VAPDCGGGGAAPGWPATSGWFGGGWFGGGWLHGGCGPAPLTGWAAGGSGQARPGTNGADGGTAPVAGGTAGGGANGT
jgi:hypothetical protein